MDADHVVSLRHRLVFRVSLKRSPRVHLVGTVLASSHKRNFLLHSHPPGISLGLASYFKVMSVYLTIQSLLLDILGDKTPVKFSSRVHNNAFPIN